MKRAAILALLGGPPAVTIPPPHWQWPPRHRRAEAAVARWLRHGPNCRLGIPAVVEELEREFAAAHNMPHALALSSATACLHVAFMAAGIGPGDEVLAPTVTFPASITPVFHLGARPVLCDVLPENGTIDPADVARRITRRTKALVVTHLWGHPCRMDELLRLARRHKLLLIEDCAHAVGATWRGRRVGSFGDFAVFSFDSQKMLAAGEAGLLLCRTRRGFERAVVVSDLGARTTSQVTSARLRRYRATGLGLKYRVHPLGAVIALEKFRQLAALNASRQRMLDYFTAKLRVTGSIRPPVIAPDVTMGAHYGYKPSYRQGWCRGLGIATYVCLLQAEGVDVRLPATPALHRTPLFRQPGQAQRLFPHLTGSTPRPTPRDFPQAEMYQRRQLSFPTFTFPRERTLIDQYATAIAKVEALLTGQPQLAAVARRATRRRKT